MSGTGLSLDQFIGAYESAVPLTMNLCSEVMANCFVNASYDPVARNGSCPDKVDEFYVGYAWENGDGEVQWRNDSVRYPFPNYGQTEEWRSNVVFAVNTALDYIV